MKALRVLPLFLLSLTAVADEASLLQEQRSYFQNQLDRINYELLAYVLDNKLATAALIAAGTGVAAFLKENMDQDTKSALAAVGIVGAFYCLGNPDECAKVFVQFGSYAVKIEKLQNQIGRIDSRLAAIAGGNGGRSGGRIYHMVCLSNDIGGKIYYQYRWGSGPWQKAVLKSGYYQWISNLDNKDFRVRFDGSGKTGYQEKVYTLEARKSAEQTCQRAAKYRFVSEKRRSENLSELEFQVTLNDVHDAPAVQP